MRLVKGVLDRCLEVIELLATEVEWQRLSDIAVKLDLQKGPTHRLLTQMVELGWIEQDEETERYRLTLKLALLGQQYLYGTGLPGLVQPILDAVAGQCHELVRMTVVAEEQLKWFASSQGAAPGLMYQPSMSGSIALHATANGKVWLASMRDEEAVRIALQQGLGREQHLGPHAMNSVDALIKELEITRLRGYGLANEEAESGVNAIAIAVRAQPEDHVVGTMSIAGPVSRMGADRTEAYYDYLTQAAAKLRMIWPRNK